MKKKKRTKKTKKSNNSYVNKTYLIIILILTGLIFLSGIYLGYIINSKKISQNEKKCNNTIKILKNKISKLEKENKNLKKQFPKQNKVVSSEIEDYLNAKTILPPKIPEKEKITKHQINKSKKPKLVIIIDDVAFKYQVNLIKQIPYKITPSFFPPTKRHPNTDIFAKNFSHYMVHLPLEAIHFNKPEPNTLNINTPYYIIKKRIDYIHKIFPKAKYINNHTGSTFTTNYNAMLKLFKALKSDNLNFVDSKTTPYSKANKAQKVYHINLYSRNIFLDNIEKPSYIKNQLKKAVNIARKRGYAIAIGHPHKITLLTLKNSKNILKNVEVVYIDELNKSR